MRFLLLIFLIVLIQACANNTVTPVHNIQQSDSEYLMKSPSGILLTVENIETSLRAAPLDAKRSILGNGDKFMAFVSGRYLTRQLNEYAISEKLDQESKYLATLQDYKNRLLANLAVEHYIGLQDKPDFNDLAYERYLVNQSKYQTQNLLKLSHILIRTGKKHADAEALQIATEVLEKAKSGNDFAKLAKQYSEDSSATMSGDLGWVKKGQMVRPFEKAAFNLQKDRNISDVVKTRFGYHIIKLFEKKAARQQSFEEVKPSIIRSLESEHAKELQSQMVLKYDVSDDTKINNDEISALYIRLKKAVINQ